jgi:hypothetical protein
MKNANTLPLMLLDAIATMIIAWGIFIFFNNASLVAFPTALIIKKIIFVKIVGEYKNPRIYGLSILITSVMFFTLSTLVIELFVRLIFELSIINDAMKMSCIALPFMLAPDLIVGLWIFRTKIKEWLSRKSH